MGLQAYVIRAISSIHHVPIRYVRSDSNRILTLALPMTHQKKGIPMNDRPIVESKEHGLASVALLLMVFCLTGCGGTKILKEPKNLDLQGSLVVESDAKLTAGFDWVIVRDGPGTWAKNADWDEYLFRIHNTSDDEISIESVVIYDSLDTMITSDSSRKQLIKGSRAASKRYKEEGLKVKAGLGGMGLVAVGGTSLVSGAALGTAVMFSTGTTAAAAGVVAAGAILAAPVLVVGGIFRGVNNNKVANEIEDRQTNLPLTLNAGDATAVNIFFPLSPSPTRIEISYSDADGQHLLTMNTGEALDGLHLRVPEQEIASD